MATAPESVSPMVAQDVARGVARVFLRLRTRGLRLRCRDGGTGDGRDGRSKQ